MVIAVIPAFHEGPRIGQTVRAVLPYVDSVLVVDDGSPDDTCDRAKRAGAVILCHSVNRGQGAALKTGTEAALKCGADIVLHIDADGQHDPMSIPNMLQPLLEERADVVFGSRFLGHDATGMPFNRRMLLSGARTFNALAVGVPRKVTDPQSGFRALSSSAAKKINFRQDRMAHCSEILRLVTRSGLRWCEVPVRVHYSADTLRKGQKPWDAAKIAWQLFLGVFTR
ncbi:MAG: glycosyltransferase family 2 protein [Patescibacteria group bacterium]|nr:glycosyltransferase family 2 protein [Patescibacteria group bacterium]MBU2509099.1 glycosyltransferase family 2 protein [Patescibacteria group bacterium]